MCFVVIGKVTQPTLVYEWLLVSLARYFYFLLLVIKYKMYIIYYFNHTDDVLLLLGSLWILYIINNWQFVKRFKNYYNIHLFNKRVILWGKKQETSYFRQKALVETCSFIIIKPPILIYKDRVHMENYAFKLTISATMFLVFFPIELRVCWTDVCCNSF
jgi:hypothetical protein